MTTPTSWQDQIARVGATVGVQQVDVLFDQAAWHNNVVGTLEQLRPVVPWFSLFTGTPEENLLEQAPILMRLDLTDWKHRAWLEEMVTYCAADARLLVVISPLSFQTLSHALRSLSQMKWGGQDGLLRYYDPRIFPLLMSSILTPEQQDEYRQLAFYWGWLDRDDQAQWLRGNAAGGKDSVEVSAFLELSDQQCELVGCIGDAQELLAGRQFDHLHESREQRFSLLYSLVLKASRENYFGDLSEYVGKAI